MLKDLLYGIIIWTNFSSVLSQFTPLTDRRTDRHTDGQRDSFLVARPRYMQCSAVNNHFRSNPRWPAASKLDI